MPTEKSDIENERINRLKEAPTSKSNPDNPRTDFQTSEIKALSEGDKSRALKLKKSTGELKEGVHATCAYFCFLFEK